ncbi:adenylate/guanylate cyclase domain-containing protein [Mycolicibacterium sp. NCC-Tsukiji]|uniref:adenylate/guanylate cyclase domain-containing protein n=1 Tax=Mycolicibacterium sp. NCC-Tsukiji TaxID=2185272 RepID=UPI0035B5559B
MQVSASTHSLLAHRYAFSDPQVVEVKGKGPMTTYFLEGALLDRDPAVHGQCDSSDVPT